MRRSLLLAALLGLLAFPPQCSLSCGDGRGSWPAPDGNGVLTACARPMLFAMPGQGGDAPGWLVLRDRAGWIAGVTSLGMVQTLEGNGDLRPIWSPAGVHVPLHAEMPRAPAPAAPVAFLTDRAWRWRALLGLTPVDLDHR